MTLEDEIAILKSDRENLHQRIKELLEENTRLSRGYSTMGPGHEYEIKKKPYCCKVGCDKDAEYEIWSGNKPNDYLHSCLEHIPDLMTDAKRHEIITLDAK